jgi:molecular chaperone Hsp33
MLQNTLQQGLTLDAKVRYIFVEASDIAETARKRHNLDPISTRYCAESIAASLLLASQIKGDERITVQIVSETPKCSVLCDINAQGAIRAKISPPDMVTSIRQLQKESKLSEFRFQLHGYMVTIKHNKYQEIYRGITEIENQTITEALQHYFQQSAQIDCVMKIAVQQNTDGSIHAVTGIILERYPESLEIHLPHQKNFKKCIPPYTPCQITNLWNNCNTKNCVPILCLPWKNKMCFGNVLAQQKKLMLCCVLWVYENWNPS